MSTITESNRVDVPVRTAYNQWTQFEEFPQFMEGVKECRQIDDTHLHWVAEIAGVQREWDAEIVEQQPDKIVAWRSTTEPVNAGAVRFEPSASGGCVVEVTMEYDPSTLTEKAGDMLGIVRRRVENDVRRFKEFIEERGVETGGWRDEVHAGVKEEGEGF